jgi:hypothetical protein
VSAPAFKPGDSVVHLRLVPFGEIYRTTVARETPTQWIDAKGYRWSKRTGERVPRGPCRRLLVTPEDFERRAKELPC